jgi:hypothetical protein
VLANTAALAKCAPALAAAVVANTIFVHCVLCSSFMYRTLNACIEKSRDLLFKTHHQYF